MDMDDEVTAKTKRPVNTMIVRVTPQRLVIALLAVFLILLIMRSGLGVANEAELEISRSTWGFHIGVVTILFGVLFVALGIPIIVNLFLKLSEQLLKHDENSIYTGLVHYDEAGVGEIKPIRIIIGRILVTLITMIMLAWASYTGYRLATEPKRDDKYYPLIFPIGVVTIAFGVVYIIIGLAVIADLALALTAQYILRKKKGLIAQQDPDTETKCSV